MDKDKSIIAKFSEAMKGLADSAAEALKAEKPPKIGEHDRRVKADANARQVRERVDARTREIRG